MLQDIRFTHKVVRSILSGYSNVELRQADDENGVYFIPAKWNNGKVSFETFDAPHFLCVVFNDGRHLPVPILFGEGDENPIQSFVVDWFCKHTTLLDAALYESRMAYAWMEREVAFYGSQGAWHDELEDDLLDQETIDRLVSAS